MGWLRRAAARWLKLPPAPRPPAGSEASVRVFRAAPNYYRYALARWVLRQVGVVVGVLFVFGSFFPFQDLLEFEVPADAVDRIVARVPPASWADRMELFEVRPLADDPELVVLSVGPTVFWFEMLGLALIALQAPLTYTLVRLDYELRWYIVTDRSLRIREGITSVRESTMTFANIQNLAIEQGPVQRLLGISDLKVRTAGGGSKGEEFADEAEKAKAMHIGYFRGVDNGPELRDAILAQLQRLKDGGLDDVVRHAPSDDADAVRAVDAARAVLDEARAIRLALEPGQ